MKERQLLLLFLSVLLICSACAVPTPRENESDTRMDWWREARFGMFIHFGIYSNHDSWDVRRSAQVPVEEYNLLLDKFNPTAFDANEWVKMAKDAGMKYIVITTKHHDGFALFDSKWSDFDVMATPFKRDIIKELADACENENIKLGFYYSILDWNNPDYLPRMSYELANRPVAEADMDNYVGFMKNQLTELHENYGQSPAIWWFDGEWDSTWTHERGKDLYQFLRQADADVIINNRIDKGRKDNGGITSDRKYRGDFGTPEQEVPISELGKIDWESCITMNDNWSYNKNDNNWKSDEELVRTLIDIASKGGNLLLNVGPEPSGRFPEESIQRLKAIGGWMEVNHSAIYGTKQGRFQDLSWGRCTQKVADGKTYLYFHIFDWPADNKLILTGFPDEVISVYSLSNSAQRVQFTTSEKSITIDLSGVEKSAFATVIAVEVLE